MTNERPPLEPGARLIATAGVLGFLAGIVAWIWVGELRMFLTGAVVLLGALIAIGLLYPGPRRS
jgi:CHASE2 domain-containing sensor protein